MIQSPDPDGQSRKVGLDGDGGNGGSRLHVVAVDVEVVQVLANVWNADEDTGVDSRAGAKVTKLSLCVTDSCREISKNLYL